METHSQAAVDAAIVAVKNGDENAYAVLVDAFQKRLRQTLALKCPPGVEADEVAQIAFIEAYRRIHAFEVGTKFYVWLWVIARYVLMGQIQKIRRASHNRDNYMNRMLLGQYETEGYETNGNDSHAEALLACLAILSESARVLMRNRYEHGRSLKEIARILNRTVGSLKVQLHHIRMGLRHCVSRKLAMEQ